MEKFSYAARASSSFLQNNARTKKFNQQNFTKIRNTTGKKSKWSNNLTIYPNRVERLWLDGEKFCFPALRCFRTVDPKDYRMLWDVLEIRLTSSLLQFTCVIKLCDVTRTWVEKLFPTSELGSLNFTQLDALQFSLVWCRPKRRMVGGFEALVWVSFKAEVRITLSLWFVKNISVVARRCLKHQKYVWIKHT